MHGKRPAHSGRSWPASPAEAIALQNELRKLVIPKPTQASPRVVAGVDVSVRGGSVRAAVVTLSIDDFSLLETKIAVRPARFPYIPGLLAFREAPVILDAFCKLKSSPDIMLVDGHGTAHPRRFGLACHIGVELDLPSIGCAKTRLVGRHRDPADRKGAFTDLVFKDEVVGRVVRTREGVKPVYVSIGHKVDLDTAVSVTIRCLTRYRLPEPIRRAHKAAGEKP